MSTDIDIDKMLKRRYFITDDFSSGYGILIRDVAKLVSVKAGKAGFFLWLLSLQKIIMKNMLIVVGRCCKILVNICRYMLIYVEITCNSSNGYIRY